MDELRFDGRVVVNDLGCDDAGRGSDPAPAESVVAEIRAAGGEAVASVHDVRSPAAAAELVRAAAETYAPPDIVVCSAGIVTHTDVLETTAEELDAHLHVDPGCSFNVIAATWPEMARRGYGRIVVSSSSAAFGGATEIAYSAAKAGFWALARSFALAGADRGITVNTVVPFGVTRMTAADSRVTPDLYAAREALAPAERASSLVAALVHESCRVSGELPAAGAGRVTRLLVRETAGIFERALTPEDVASRWDEILVEETVRTVTGAQAHVRGFYAAVPGWDEAVGRAGP